MSNFLFLKKNNTKLFSIISEAENLFRDEYFEQSEVQVRRFAENLCRDLLQDKVSPEDTFDSMINKIKDNSFENTRMKEFSDDLYFLKKRGNASAHSSSAFQNGKLALECLERAFEIAIFYSNIKFGYNKSLDKEVFSEEMLMTGKKTAKKNLQAKYSRELENARKAPLKTEMKKKTSSPKVQKTKKQNSKAKTTKGRKANKKAKQLNIKTILVLIISVMFATYAYLFLAQNGFIQ